ncbi:MAG: hypothetical protein M1827_006553 [Pycnora praestabilis]|nr:MAG: hypothetical protein M1827_006553 [Pycnora praestabilis]
MVDSRKAKVNVSILDIFASGPRTIRTKKKAPTKAPPPDGPSSVTPAPPEIQAAANAAAAPGWTAEQDATLLKYKTENKSWKEISIMLDDKPIWQLKNRFKELRSLEETPVVAGQEKKEEAKDETKSEDKTEEKKLEEGKAEEKKPDGKVEEKIEEEKPKRISDQPKVIYLDGDKDLSRDEFVLLVNLSNLYDDRKWLQIASTFYDRTGRRLSPEMVREKIG